MTQILLTVIVLGAGTDYGLFLVYRVREELAGRPGGAARRSARGRPGGRDHHLSALCVVSALLSVVLADFGLYRGLGPGLAIGVAVGAGRADAAPRAAGHLGRAFWPTRPRPGHEYRGVWGGSPTAWSSVPAGRSARARRCSSGSRSPDRLQAGRLRRPNAPSGSDSAAGRAGGALPGGRPQPDKRHLPPPRRCGSGRSPPRWRARPAPAPLAPCSGAWNPTGRGLPAPWALHAALGPPQRLPGGSRRARGADPRRGYAAYGRAQFITPTAARSSFTRRCGPGIRPAHRRSTRARAARGRPCRRRSARRTRRRGRGAGGLRREPHLDA